MNVRSRSDSERAHAGRGSKRNRQLDKLDSLGAIPRSRTLPYVAVPLARLISTRPRFDSGRQDKPPLTQAREP